MISKKASNKNYNIKKSIKKTINKNNTNKTETYFTHDNGGRPFKVELHDKTVKIYKHVITDTNDNHENPEYKLVLTYKVKDYFVGLSPKNEMTLFSGGHGSKFTGNSILLHIDNNDYIFVGERIFSFKSMSEIIKYVSPVGNSDVPYPYAIDRDGHVYLMIENVILSKYDGKKDDDPYDYYYVNHNMINYKGIQDFFIGKKSYNLTYYPYPAKDYDRITNFHDKPEKLSIKINGKIVLYTKEKYVKLMREFGVDKGFIPFETHIIIDRLY